LVGEAVAVTVDDARLEALLDRPARAVLGDDVGAADALEHLEQRLEGVVALAASVVDEVEADVDLLLGQLAERGDASGVHDGRVEARLLALVEVDGVEGVAGCGLEAEGDVGQSEDGVDPWQLLLDEPYPLDGLDAVAAALLHSRAARAEIGRSSCRAGRL